MNSSISSSNGRSVGLAGALRLVSVHWPIGVVAVGLFIALMVVHWVVPRAWPVSVDEVVFRAQQDRAATIRDFQWLIAGDSSGLTGISAPQLTQVLGQRVEVLSTMAAAGPGTHASLVSSALKRTDKANVLLVINSQGVFQTVEKFGKWEALLKNERRRPRVKELPEKARDSGFSAISMFAFHLPLPGNYGRRYGWPEDLEASLGANHGSMEDPNYLKKCAEGEPLRFKMSSDFRQRLAQFREAVAHFPGVSLRLLVSPSPHECTSPHFSAERERTIEELLRILALNRGAFIDTPATFPMQEFATPTHLNDAGRTRLTALVAQGLAAQANSTAAKN